MQEYVKVATYPSICDEWYDSVTNGIDIISYNIKKHEINFVEWREKCIFAVRKFMFPVGVHKFQAQKHVFSERKHKFSAQKHKIVLRSR